MGLVRRAGAAAACALLAGAAAPALASAHRIPVLSPDGSVHRHAVPAAATQTLPVPPGAGRRAAAQRHSGARAAAHRTALSELRRLHSRGRIDDAAYAQARRSYHRANGAIRRLSGARRSQLQAVVNIINNIAARGKLTPSRVPALWLTLDRNREWWTTAPWIPAPGERVGFSQDELVWQYYAGSGLQIQWLGTFGLLNALATGTKRQAARADRLADVMLPLASWRAGGWAWEYLFPFDGGAPPWTSSLSQGTALQALARTAQRLGRQADILPKLARAITIFQHRTPTGVRVPTGHGRAHYAQYSFAPSLRILNGFIQSLNGLFDYSSITGDATAGRLFEQGEAQAEREVPMYDTGAWSLYSRGTSTHESDLNYHVLLRDFLKNLCRRTHVAVFCDTAQRFTADLTTPPVVTVPAQRLRAGHYGTLRLRLDKMSALTVTVRRGDTVVLSRALGTVPYGTLHVAWAVPRRRGTYDVSVSARDLAGNTAQAAGTVTVRRR
jgi:D-glucuronyl C5-epimerase C-terminus